MRHPSSAFTLAELLVSIAVLAILVLIASQMVNSAANIARLGSNRMDVESQARAVFDRMALDFAGMIKRPDVDYYVKSNVDPENGNDRIAFFCNSPGYYPSTGSQSPLSLIAYRINADGSNSRALNRMERMAKGLLWNGVIDPSDTPMLFGPQAIAYNWPAAISDTAPDSDYESFAPQVLRFEYSYVLKTGEISDEPGAAGMQDVTAIAVTLAAIDQKSRQLFSDDQVTNLITRLKDFDKTQPASDLVVSWQASLDQINDMPRVAVNGVRIYQRYFNLVPLR